MYDLDRLNSATKYPSIPTLHPLSERGIPLEPAIPFAGQVILTEKIDGCSSRVIRMPDGDWFIGSREELLTARGDRVANASLGIAGALADLADRLVGDPYADNLVTVYYLETYGAQIGTRDRQYRKYTGTGAVSFRMFDLAFVPLDVLDWERPQIAAWRDAGCQPFANESVLQRAAEAEGIELTPRLGTLAAADLPATVADTLTWLAETIPATRAALDALAGGQPEGIVLRAADRSVIAKARFEDYMRTLTQAERQRAARPAGARV